MSKKSGRENRVIFLLVTFVMLFMFATREGQSGLSSSPRDETWLTNGKVEAIIRTTDTVYIGGNFSRVGPYTGCWAPINDLTGQVEATFPKVNGTIYAQEPDGSGGWCIAGAFSQVGGYYRPRIAHILADGSVDPDWFVEVDMTLFDLKVSNSIIYVCGFFSSINGETRNNIAAIDAVTGNVTSWNPDADAPVYTLEVSSDGSSIYAGGLFSSIGGASRNKLAKLDATTGAATSWNPNPTGGVSTWIVSLALSADDSTIYPAGTYTSIGGQARNNLAAINTSTGNATSWDPNPDDMVIDLTLSSDGSIIYAGGDFGAIGGKTRNRIAALDVNSTGAVTAFNPNGNHTVRAIALSQDGSTVYVGGDFATMGGQSRSYLAALDATTGAATTWDPHPFSRVRSIAVSGSTVYAGGEFCSLGGVERLCLAALDASTGSPASWNPGVNGTISSLAMSGDGSTIYAGGYFTSVGGQARNSIAAIDTTTGVPGSWNPNADTAVKTLAVSGSTIYAGGLFSTIGGQTRNHLAALDATTGNATGWNPNPDNTVEDIAVTQDGSTVYVGGWFGNIGGQARRNIAALDAGTGNANSWDPSASSIVETITLSNDESTVYAGGRFILIGGQGRNYIAEIDAGAGAATAWDPDADDWVMTLALSEDGSTIFAGGEFENIGGQARYCLASIDAASGNVNTWNPGAYYPKSPFALATWDSTVYVGGWFNAVDDDARDYFAQFDSEYTAPSSSLTALADTTRVGTTLNLPFTSSDTGGSGIRNTTLWVKTPGSSSFTNTGLTFAGIGGAFSYTTSAGASYNGLYEFATQAGDYAENLEAQPTEMEVAVLLNTVENGEFTQILPSADSVTTFPMTNDIDVLIETTGASPGGSISVFRTVDNVAPPGYDPDQMIDEYLTITGAGLGSGWSAAVTWEYDEASDDGLLGVLDSVFQFDGPSLMHTYSVTPTGTTLYIPGVTSFSHFLAGNQAAGICDWLLMK